MANAAHGATNTTTVTNKMVITVPPVMLTILLKVLLIKKTVVILLQFDNQASHSTKNITNTNKTTPALCVLLIMVPQVKFTSSVLSLITSQALCHIYYRTLYEYLVKYLHFNRLKKNFF